VRSAGASAGGGECRKETARVPGGLATCQVTSHTRMLLAESMRLAKGIETDVGALSQRMRPPYRGMSILAAYGVIPRRVELHYQLQ